MVSVFFLWTAHWFSLQLHFWHLAITEISCSQSLGRIPVHFQTVSPGGNSQCCTERKKKARETPFSPPHTWPVTMWSRCECRLFSFWKVTEMVRQSIQGLSEAIQPGAYWLLNLQFGRDAPLQQKCQYKNSVLWTNSWKTPDLNDSTCEVSLFSRCPLHRGQNP